MHRLDNRDNGDNGTIIIQWDNNTIEKNRILLLGMILIIRYSEYGIPYVLLRGDNGYNRQSVQ